MRSTRSSFALTCALWSCLALSTPAFSAEIVLQPENPPGTFTPPVVGGCAEPPYLLGFSAPGINGVRVPAYNRLEWWDKTPPNTGAITKPFECEFTPGLAVVVGSAMRTVEQAGHRVRAWDLPSPGLQNLGQLQGTQFSIRSQRPQSHPGFRRAILGGGTSMFYLVNDVSPGTTLSLAPGQFRPSLWIDFERPQRAVGLEYGVEPMPGQPPTIRGAGVHLIAYDARGTEITRSRGDKSGVGVNVLSTASFDSRIGVRDREARIMTVELRFERDGDPSTEPNAQIIRAPQRLFRVWHEQLPAATVKQGRVATKAVTSIAGGEPIATGLVNLTLPFKHDRATVFMRGFRINFDDGQPHPVGMVHAALRDSKNAAVTNAVFRTTPGGSISFRAAGGFFTGRSGSVPASTAVIHYSALSWNSAETEIVDRPIVWDFDLGDLDFGSSDAFATNPMPAAGTGTSTDRQTWLEQTEALRGGLALMPQDLQWRAENDDDVELLSWSPGSYLWGGLGWTSRNVGLFGALFIQASMNTGFEGDGYRDFFGSSTVLTGRSVLTTPHPHPDFLAAGNWTARPIKVIFTAADTSDRTSLAAYKQPWPANRAAGLSYPVFAEAAGVRLGHFSVEPGGEVREIDVEVHAANYQNGLIDWQTGGSSSDQPAGTTVTRPHLAFPEFFAVRALAEFAKPTLNVTPMTFAVWDGGIMQKNASQSDGEVVNLGTGDALLTRIEPGSLSGAIPEDFRVSYTFVWRGGAELTLAEMQQRLPLQLRPGEKLIVRGRYTGIPNSAAGGAFTESPSLAFRTGEAGFDTAMISTARVSSGTPAGQWSAASLRFNSPSSFFQPGQYATVISSGNVPLQVYSVTSDDSEFTVELPAGSGNGGPYLIKYRGSVSGFRVGRIRADTNAGFKDLRVEGFNGP